MEVQNKKQECLDIIEEQLGIWPLTTTQALALIAGLYIIKEGGSEHLIDRMHEKLTTIQKERKEKGYVGTGQPSKDSKGGKV